VEANKLSRVVSVEPDETLFAPVTDRLGTGPLDALTTIDIALQVSSALAAAEKQGLVHRDLKPANLMFVAAAPDANDSSRGKAEKADTVVKVIDFGVAKALVEKPDAMGLTHGGFVGTPAFASPEQFTDARVEVRSDIYSLGATLWYLLTGHRPFQGATIEQIRASGHSQALPIEQLKAARVPSRLVSLLVSMLAPEPAARPGVRALTSQLQDCRAQILEEQTQLAAKPTQNPEAYLQAEERGGAGWATFKGLDSIRMVEHLYSEAVALDPAFALARARLSATLAYRYHDFEPNQAVKRRARAEAEEALRLQPNLGEG
jgi:serine/threonine protein kinase